MKKKLILSAAVVAVVGAASFAALNSITQPRKYSALELANINALTQGEGTPVKNCLIYSSYTNEWGHFYRCEDRTTDDMIYPCPDLTMYLQKGVTTKCTK